MDNQRLLKSNIEQAYFKYGEENLSEVVKQVFPKIIDNRELILSNLRRLTKIKDQVSEKVVSVYGNVPDVTIVPCVGLFVASGWANKEGEYHVFIALEFPHREMDIILSHEVAHAVSQDTWDTVLDGFYREGHAVYVSSVLYPGHGDEEYLFMSEELYHKCLKWMETNREKILKDSTEPLKVLNRYHKFYFTTGYNPDYPNIGYVIGYHYVKYLNRKYSLPELLDFGLKKKETETEFTDFINDAGIFTEGS
ncbi:MAG: hypothetical protein NWE89_03115 [Candidatus Bathyarchaeota archaeon]|nr:hypothetical protein [Candidatus Bathyarchaeota archaeon]